MKKQSILVAFALLISSISFASVNYPIQSSTAVEANVTSCQIVSQSVIAHFLFDLDNQSIVGVGAIQQLIFIDGQGIEVTLIGTVSSYEIIIEEIIMHLNLPPGNYSGYTLKSIQSVEVTVTN